MKNFIDRILYWAPSRVFYTTKFDGYVKYDSPVNLGFGFTSEGYSKEHREYTRLGQWFKDKPAILYFLFGLLYYPVVGVLYFFVWFVAVILDMLFSKWE